MIKDTFEKNGIYGVNYNNPREQNLLCPSEECRSRKKSKLKTLRVNVAKQTWHCAHCGWSGYLQIPNSIIPTSIIAPMPFIPPPNPTITLSPEHRSWLNQRGISDTTIEQFKLYTSIQWVYGIDDIYVEGKYNCISYPYFRSGEIINAKYRASGKRFKLNTGSELIAYNQDCLLLLEDYVIITEGEMDCLTIYEAGFKSVISPPNGANLHTNNLEWLNKIYDEVNSKAKIYLALDNDTAGRQLFQDLSRRFDSNKIYEVKYPDNCKDSNDVLLNHSTSVLYNCIVNAKQIPLEGIIDDDNLGSLAMGIYENGYPQGVTTGWKKLDEHVKFIRGEFIVVTGIPTHGKSVFCENLMMKLALKENWKLGVSIMESDPEVTVINMVQMMNQAYAHGINRISPDRFMSSLDFIKNSFKFFNINEFEKNSLDEILKKGVELVHRYGIDMLYIDPWSYVEKDLGKMTDNQFFESCLPKIRTFRKKYNCAVLVVAHPRKMDNDMKSGKPRVPGPYDIGGSNQWYGAPDKIMTVYCNYREDKKVDFHEIHIQKEKKWWFGGKGMVEMKLNTFGLFEELSDSQHFDYKKAQANDDFRGKDDIMDEDQAPF